MTRCGIWSQFAPKRIKGKLKIHSGAAHSTLITTRTNTLANLAVNPVNTKYIHSCPVSMVHPKKCPFLYRNISENNDNSKSDSQMANDADVSSGNSNCQNDSQSAPNDSKSKVDTRLESNFLYEKLEERKDELPETKKKDASFYEGKRSRNRIYRSRYTREDIDKAFDMYFSGACAVALIRDRSN